MTKGPGRSGISDVYLDGLEKVEIRSERGPRGDDDYTPITDYNGLTRKLGQIHNHAAEIPVLRAKIEQTAENLLVLQTKHEYTDEKIKNVEDKLDKGHSCHQTENIQRTTESVQKLSDSVFGLEKFDTALLARVEITEDYVKKSKDTRSKFLFWFITSIISALIAASGLFKLSSMEDEKETTTIRGVEKRIELLQEESKKGQAELIQYMHRMKNIEPTPQLTEKRNSLQDWCKEADERQKRRLRGTLSKELIPEECR